MEHVIMNIKKELKGISMIDLSNLSGINKSVISRYLNGKTTLSMDRVDKLYQCIGEFGECDRNSKYLLVSCVKDLYHTIIDKQEPAITFQDYFNSNWRFVRDECYFIWLIGILLYMCFYKEKLLNIQLKKLINILIEHEMYIPFEFCSMLYCTLSIYYAKNKNLEKCQYYLTRAKSSASNEIELGYTLYQQGRLLSYLCCLTDALDCFNHANVYYTKSFYMNASVNVQIEIAIVYQKLGQYAKADKLFNDCKKYIQQKNIGAVDKSRLSLIMLFNDVVAKS